MASLLQRFEQLHTALTEDLSWFNDKGSYRFVALCALPGSDSPQQSAQRIHAFSQSILSKQSWFSDLRSTMRIVVAALLHGHGDTPEAFIAEVERVQQMFRQRQLRRGGIYECVAVLVMRLQRHQQPITEADVDRLCEIYEVMKRYHWWLTGPEDLPACGLLVDHPGSVSEVGKHAEGIYTGLRQRGFSGGDSLQHAAHFLTISQVSVDAAVSRFCHLAERFRQQDVSIWSNDYDELAMLSHLDCDADELVERVLQYRMKVTAMRPKPNAVTSFGIACDLVFLEQISESDESTRGLEDLKPLLNLQEVIQAQRAAAIAAAT